MPNEKRYSMVVDSIGSKACVNILGPDGTIPRDVTGITSALNSAYESGLDEGRNEYEKEGCEYCETMGDILNHAIDCRKEAEEEARLLKKYRLAWEEMEEIVRGVLEEKTGLVNKHFLSGAYNTIARKHGIREE
jgi:hypothetical protein